MDNFIKPKRIIKRSNSVDGMIPRRSATPNVRQQFGSTYQPPPRQNIAVDNFKRQGGYNSSTAQSASTAIDTKAPLYDSGFDQKSRHKHKIRGAKRSPFKRVLRTVVVLIIISAIGVGGVAGYGYVKALQVFQGGGSSAALEKNVDPTKLKGEGDGRINIVMLGIGGEGHEGAYLTDTILIASVDPVQNETALLSVPRDLWVKQENGSATKINAVYALTRDSIYAKTKDKTAATQAAATITEKTLSTVLGIPINYYMVVDFNGFQKAVDTVGGLDLKVTADTAVTDYMYNETTQRPYVLDVKAGQQHFDGLRALFYSRSRHTSPRGDFDRAARQRLLLEAFKEKVQSAGTYANPVKVTQLLSSFGDHVRTDLTINEMMRLYDISKAITPDKIASMSLVDPPNVLLKTATIDTSGGALSIVQPIAGLFEYADIQNFVRNNVKDAFLKNENASIIILNGTSTGGLASKKSAELKSYGYNVTSVADAPTKTYTKTVLIDLRNGTKKYTKNYLQKRLGLTALTALPDTTIQPGAADFVIILGTDTH